MLKCQKYSVMVIKPEQLKHQGELQSLPRPGKSLEYYQTTVSRFAEKSEKQIASWKISETTVIDIIHPYIQMLNLS